MRAEKPAWYLAVISGALLRTLDFVAARSAEYLGYLEKGQLPPARLTLTAFEEAFVLDGEKSETFHLHAVQRRSLGFAQLKGLTRRMRAGPYQAG